MAPIIVDWASRKSNAMASLLVDELRAKGKPSAGWCFFFPLFDIQSLKLQYIC